MATFRHNSALTEGLQRKLIPAGRKLQNRCWECAAQYSQSGDVCVQGSVPKPSEFSHVLQSIRAVSYKFLHLCISSVILFLNQFRPPWEVRLNGPIDGSP